MIKTRYAHRGYHGGGVPENSLPAFERALEHGWGAELDVHLLSDGSLAVFHDSELQRCTGESGMIEELDKEKLKAFRLKGSDCLIPMLDEVLELFEGAQPLIIELKTCGGNHKALAGALCKRLDSYKGDLCVESFDPRALLAVKSLRPGIIRGQLSQDFYKGQEAVVPAWQRRILTDMWFNILTKPDFIAYKFEDRFNAANRKALSRGVQEVCWTIRSKADLDTVENGGGIAIFEGFDPDA